MSGLTAFGLFAVSAMLICYALEARNHWFVLGFAVSCCLGSAYGFLQGAWPFGVVEAIWAVVAARRWYSRKAHRPIVELPEKIGEQKASTSAQIATDAPHGRSGAVRIGCVLSLVLPVILFVLALFWYDKTAITVAGVIAWKQEKVSLYTTVPVADEPYVERSLLLHVRYTPPGSPEISTGVRASPARYDAAHVGDTVPLHFLRAWPRITIGLADRTALDRLRDLRAMLGERNGTWLLWSVGGVMLMLFARSFGNAALLFVALAWLVSAWPVFFFGRAQISVSGASASAMIGDVVHVTHTPHWGTDASILDARHLTVPYTEVELTYVPGPGVDSVRAVDAVDSASTSLLATGATIPIRYDQSSPRQAQIQRATRDYRFRNRFDLWPETIAPAVFGVLAALFRLKRRRRPVGISKATP